MMEYMSINISAEFGENVIFYRIIYIYIYISIYFDLDCTYAQFIIIIKLSHLVIIQPKLFQIAQLEPYTDWDSRFGF